MNGKEGSRKHLKFPLYSLKHLVERSYTTKPLSEVKAILSPITPLARKTSRHKMSRCGISLISIKPKQDSQSTNEYTETNTTIDNIDSYYKLLIKKNLYHTHTHYTQQTYSDHINKILYNDKAHIVAIYKDFLIYEDIKELFGSSKYSFREVMSNSKGVSVFDTYRTNGNRVIRRGLVKKSKVNKWREMGNGCGENSTVFFSGFFDELAKEDLSNSCSEIPFEYCKLSYSEPSLSRLLNELSNDSIEVESSDSNQEPLKADNNKEPISLNSLYKILLRKKKNSQVRNCNDKKLALATVSTKRLQKTSLNKLSKAGSSNIMRALYYSKCRSGVSSKNQLSETTKSKLCDKQVKTNYFAIYDKNFLSQSNSTKNVNTANVKLRIHLKCANIFKSQAKIKLSNCMSGKLIVNTFV
jgi:hypothetical protein